MSAYTVMAAKEKKRFPGKQGGEFVVYLVQLDDGNGAKQTAELVQKAATPAPQVGDQLEGTVEQSEYGAKFKKAQRGGFGGPRPDDPKKSAHIARMHAQDMALRFVGLMHERGQLKDELKLGFLWKIADQFEQDALAAKERA